MVGVETSAAVVDLQCKAVVSIVDAIHQLVRNKFGGCFNEGVHLTA